MAAEVSVGNQVYIQKNQLYIFRVIDRNFLFTKIFNNNSEFFGFILFFDYVTEGHDHDTELDLGDEILADGIVFRDKKSPKEQLEVAIGDGMEFTIHGEFRFRI